MPRLLLMAAVALFAVGCGKKPKPATETTPAAADAPKPKADQPKPVAKADPTPPKKTEPPRLAPKYRFRTGIREVDRIALSDDGTRLIACPNGVDDNPKMEVWDLTGEPKKVRDLPRRLVAMSPGGQLVLRPGGEDDFGKVEVVDTETGAVVSKVPTGRRFYAFAGPDRVVAAGPDQAADQGKPGAVEVDVFDARTGKRASGFKVPSEGAPDLRGPVSDGRELVFGWAKAGQIQVWDLTTGKMARSVAIAPENTTGFGDFAVSRDGARMAVQLRTDKPAKLYDSATGSVVAELGKWDHTVLVPGRGLVLGKDSWVADKFQLISGWRAYDLAAKAIVADLPGSYLNPAISADGKVFVTMVDRATPELLVWDLTQVR